MFQRTAGKSLQKVIFSVGQGEGPLDNAQWPSSGRYLLSANYILIFLRSTKIAIWFSCIIYPKVSKRQSEESQCSSVGPKMVLPTD